MNPEQESSSKIDSFIDRHTKSVIGIVTLATAVVLEGENVLPAVSAPVALVRHVTGL